MSASGYFDSPWPAGDGGPARLQVPRRGAGLQLQAGEGLRCVERIDPRTLTTIDPATLSPAGPDVDCPEPSIARLGASGFTQDVVFPSPGRERDSCWSSIGRLARVFVA